MPTKIGLCMPTKTAANKRLRHAPRRHAGKSDHLACDCIAWRARWLARRSLAGSANSEKLSICVSSRNKENFFTPTRHQKHCWLHSLPCLACPPCSHASHHVAHRPAITCRHIMHVLLFAVYPTLQAINAEKHHQHKQNVHTQQ